MIDYHSHLDLDTLEATSLDMCPVHTLVYTSQELRRVRASIGEPMHFRVLSTIGTSSFHRDALLLLGQPIHEYCQAICTFR
jgi:hypothetical protein